MPNHVHGIAVIVDTVGATHASHHRSVVMTDHVHGMLVIVAPTDVPHHVHRIAVIVDTVGATRASPLPMRRPTHPSGPKKRSIGAVVGSFEAAVTKHINELRNTPGTSVWQRNYYEGISRDDVALDHIREYIVRNPLEWEGDRVGATHASPLPG